MVPADDHHHFHLSSSNSDSSSSDSSSSAEVMMMKEITRLEVQIMQLETHLLSLYRSAFHNHYSYFSTTFSEDHHHHHHHPHHPGTATATATATAGGLQSFTNKLDHHQQKDYHPTLAHHLGANSSSSSNNNNNNNNTTPDPHTLSEHIITTISCIFCKLLTKNINNNAPSSSSSPTSSLITSSSSSSTTITFSPLNPSQQDSGPYNAAAAAILQLPNINLNQSTFNYAATMLQKFRLMVQSLEKIDPRKMKREGKLAFWINIHNALAYLAYGTRSRVRSTSILKAAYNVGGHSINAYTIQSSILGIRSHHSEPWLQTLLSPGKKSKVGKHIYAIEYPEPLVHFALCSGAFSDPAVRVYTANNIFQDLKLAKKDFIQASVKIRQKASKVYLPRILDYFAKDMSLSMGGLIEIVNECISEEEEEEVGTKAVKRSMKKGSSTRPEKSICWLPQSSTFGYVIHMGLAKGIF